MAALRRALPDACREALLPHSLAVASFPATALSTPAGAPCDTLVRLCIAINCNSPTLDEAEEEDETSASSPVGLGARTLSAGVLLPLSMAAAMAASDALDEEQQPMCVRRQGRGLLPQRRGLRR